MKAFVAAVGLVDGPDGPRTLDRDRVCEPVMAALQRAVLERRLGNGDRDVGHHVRELLADGHSCGGCAEWIVGFRERLAVLDADEAARALRLRDAPAVLAPDVLAVQLVVLDVEQVAGLLNGYEATPEQLGAAVGLLRGDGWRWAAGLFGEFWEDERCVFMGGQEWTTGPVPPVSGWKFGAPGRLPRQHRSRWPLSAHLPHHRWVIIAVMMRRLGRAVGLAVLGDGHAHLVVDETTVGPVCCSKAAAVGPNPAACGDCVDLMSHYGNWFSLDEDGGRLGGLTYQDRMLFGSERLGLRAALTGAVAEPRPQRPGDRHVFRLVRVGAGKAGHLIVDALLTNHKAISWDYPLCGRGPVAGMADSADQLCGHCEKVLAAMRKGMGGEVEIRSAGRTTVLAIR